MRFVKRNKNIIIALIVFFILILLCVQVKNILFPNDGLAVYGNRLENKVELSKNIDKKIKELIPEGTKKVKVRTAGRILNITITLNDDIAKDTAKAYAKKAIEAFTEEEIGYYDLQFFLVKDSESEQFPIIGYKIPSSENITWTKDR